MAGLKRYAYSELHLSTATGFTPSAATLAAVSKSGSFTVTGLTAGTTYYYRVLHRDVRGLVSQASPQGSFVAGYVQNIQLAGGITYDKIASVNAGVLTGPGVVPLSVLNGITASQLSATAGILATQLAGNLDSGQFSRRLNNCFTYQPVENQVKVGNTSTILFGAAVSDPLTIGNVNGTFRPRDTTVFRLRAQVHVTSSPITLGCKGQVVVYNLSLAQNVDVSRWQDATLDSAGNSELVLQYDECLQLSAAYSYAVRVSVVDPTGNTLSNLTIAAANPAASPPITGSKFSLTPAIAQ